MAITRWDPLTEMRTLARRMERTFEPLFEGALEGVGEVWPPVDVYEDKEEVVFRAELPGIERKNVEVVLEDSTLTLRGERRLEREEKRENYQRIESAYGHFTRTFSLPSTVDREKVRADMKEGILEVHVPKREGARGKTIPIGS